MLVKSINYGYKWGVVDLGDSNSSIHWFLTKKKALKFVNEHRNDRRYNILVKHTHNYRKEDI